MRHPEEQEKPEYAAPAIASFGEDDLLGRVGLAQAYTGNFPFAF